MMYHFHIKRSSDNFTYIDNRVLNDNRLSFAARGLWIYLVSQKDGANISTDEVASKSPGGKKAYDEALKNLVDNGYITIEHKEGKEEVYILNEIE